MFETCHGHRPPTALAEPRLSYRIRERIQRGWTGVLARTGRGRKFSIRRAKEARRSGKGALPVNDWSLRRGMYASGLGVLAFSIAACSGNAGGGFGNPMQGDGGTMEYDGPGQGGGDARSVDAPIGSESGPSSDSGVGHDSAPPDDSGGGMDSTITVDNSDGFGAARQACINTINALRATQSLAPYTLLDTSAMDMCLDEQATNDESMDSAHYSFINNTYPACGSVPTGPFNAQDECLGYGNEVGNPGTGPHQTMGKGIIGCLYDMWAEQYQANCTGCVGCTAFGGACPNCDYYGTMDPELGECGHYVNMSATYMNTAACGFAPAPGNWAVQNFICTNPECD
jgi:hypothetical protein